MSANIHIDWTRCDGRGLCTELLPTILGRDDCGYPLPRASGAGDRTNVGIGAKDMAAAREAVALCPKLALTLKSVT